MLFLAPDEEMSHFDVFLWQESLTHFFLFRQSGRTLYLYDVNDITETIADHTVDISPAILIPDYDEDSSTVFLTGRVSVYIFCHL